MATLEIRDLHVSVEADNARKEILKGVDLIVKQGETHAIMGPNGSGKSTLAYSLAGHPKYTITSGTVTLDGEDVLAMTVDERARAGLFLAMQYPVEIPGVSVSNFLRTSATAVRGEAPKLRTWVKEVKETMADLQMDPAFAERNVNEGFSGGEKKRHEILQLELLAEGRDPRRDRLRPGRRRPARRLRGRQPGPRDRRGRHTADHALHADPPLHQARLRTRLRQRPYCRVRRRRARRQAGERGLRGICEGWRFRVTQLPGLLDTEAIRKDFPLLDRTVHDGKKIVYLDSAATSQKPRQVLDALSEYYERHNANVHRGVYTIAEEATALYEGARDKVAAFINAPSRNEVIFTKNASESLNLVANMLGWADEPYRVDHETEIVITEMEHHSNIVPWQLLSQRTGAKLKWFGITDDGRLDLSNIDEIITEKTKIVSFTLVSNIMGTINPVEKIIRRAQQVGALVCIDASQAAPHMVLDVQALQADFVAFTGHKMVGPTGIGVLWGRHELLEDLPPFLGGGEMIETVSMHSSTYAPAPHKFEAGTPPIAQAVGLGAAVDYLSAIGMDKIFQHEHAITEYAVKRLLEVPDLKIIGPATAEDRGATISFTLGDIHPHDVGQVLDEQGIAVRVGHHCARPVCLRYGIPATTRASFYLYSTPAEVDALVDGLEHVRNFFG